MRVCKHGCDVLDSPYFENYFKESDRALFPCLHSLTKKLGGLGEFSQHNLSGTQTINKNCIRTIYFNRDQ